MKIQNTPLILLSILTSISCSHSNKYSMTTLSNDNRTYTNNISKEVKHCPKYKGYLLSQEMSKGDPLIYRVIPIECGSISRTDYSKYFNYEEILSKDFKDGGCIRKECAIGVHLYYRFEDCSILDDVVISRFGDYFDATLVNTTISRKVSLMSSTSIFFSEKNSYDVTTILSKASNVKIPGLNSAENRKRYESSKGYSTQNKKIYSASEIKTQEMEYQITADTIEKIKRNETLHGHTSKVALGAKALVFKIRTSTFEAKDYWWNHQSLIKGTEKTFYSYVIVNPYITCVYETDKTL